MMRPSLIGYLALPALGLVLASCGSSRDSSTWEAGATTAAALDESGKQKEASLMSQAETAWAGRIDETQTVAAINAWKAAAELNPGNAEALTRLSRAYYYHSDCFLRFDENKQAEYKAGHDTGVRVAEKALAAQFPGFADKMRSGARIEDALPALDSAAVPALYWRSSNLARWAGIESFATLLSYKDEIREIMAFCLNAEPTYFYYAPDRYFGAFFARAPSFSGGDMNKSREHFEASIAAAPQYLDTRTLYAEEYAIKEADQALFEQLLTYNLNADPNVDPAITPENICAQKKSKQLMEDINEFF